MDSGQVREDLEGTGQSDGFFETVKLQFAQADDGDGDDPEALQRLETVGAGTLELTEEQKNALNEALKAFREQNHGHLFAVRSSSPEEDLEGASFAGGYETTLGVTVDGIEAAIRHSFTSSFDERVFVYKKEHGFYIDQPSMAVIIQQQVDAEAAGVAFSLNPLNNCYDEAVINANHGLGESVVAGEVEPDLFVVDRLRGEILETRIGSKQAVTKLNQAGGTIKSTQNNHTETAITPAQALELTRLLEKVEAYYQKPVDIEWALANNQFYLLQARPITTYLPLPPEMLTAPGQPKRLYANSTLIEQGLQEPLSVLGTDFLGYVLNKVGGAVAEGFSRGRRPPRRALAGREKGIAQGLSAVPRRLTFPLTTAWHPIPGLCRCGRWFSSSASARPAPMCPTA